MVDVRRPCWLLAVLLAARTSVAQAQPAPASAAPSGSPAAVASLEVTPQVSFSPDDGSGLGASLGFRVRPRMVVELDAQARLTNPERFQRVHANLLWDLRDAGRATLFVIVGAGYDAYRGVHQIPTVGSFGWSASGLSASVGGGARVPIAERWSLRTDVRWTGGLSEGVPNAVRVTQGLAYQLDAR